MKANVEAKALELDAQRAQLHERDRAVWHLNSSLQEKEELIHKKELHLQAKEAELKQERKPTLTLTLALALALTLALTLALALTLTLAWDIIFLYLL